MSKVVVILIHNNNEERNRHTKPNLQILLNEASKIFEVIYHEICKQPNILLQSESIFKARKIYMQALENEWQTYLENNPVSRSIHPDATQDDLRRGSIEILLTDKHLRAWDLFIEHDGDLLLCLEDDAIFYDGYIEKTLDIMRYSLDTNSEKSLYADLAGGLPLEALCVNKLILGLNENRLIFKKPVTNTACVYLINRTLAGKLKHLVTYNPNYRYIPADWLLNRLFLDLHKISVPINCFHAYPSIFGHGSLIKYGSTIR